MLASITHCEAEREFFLGVYRSAVDFYKPRIEKKTGVALGDIGVWNISCLLEHTHLLLKRRWLVNMIRNVFFRRQRQAELEAAKAFHDEWASKCSATYFNNGIYISFSSGTVHEEAIAAVVVHELSHALWERLAGRPLTWNPKPAYKEKYKLYGEGFATYAEKVWFLDLYPVSVRESVQRESWDRQGIHYRGFRRVQELVKRFGPDILPRIPREWQKLE